MQRIQLIEGDVWGHRKDINEYYSIPSSIIEEIKELKTEGKSNETIEAKISRESKLNPEIVAYIMTKDNPAWVWVGYFIFIFGQQSPLEKWN